MKVEVKKTYNDNYYFLWEDGNVKIESEILDDKEYSDEIIEILSQILYYAKEDVYEFIVENCKSEIESLGYTLSKDEGI